MSLEFLILGLAVLFLMNWLRFKDPIYPGFLQAGTWLIVMIVYYFYDDWFSRLSPEVLILLLCGTTSFTLGCFISNLEHILCRSPKVLLRTSYEANVAQKVLFWLPIVFFPLFVFRAHELAEMGRLSTAMADFWFINSRAELLRVSSREYYGVLYVLPSLGLFSAAVHLLMALSKRTRQSKVLSLVSFVVALLYSVLTTGRTAVFLLILTCIFVLLAHRRVGVGRTLFGSFAFLTVVCAFFVVVRKAGDPRLPLADSAILVSENLLIYLLAPIAALDKILHSHAATTQVMTLHFFYAVGNAMGLDVSVSPLIQPFTFVPVPVNVYTFYQPYLNDLGWGGPPPRESP